MSAANLPCSIVDPSPDQVWRVMRRHHQWMIAIAVGVVALAIIFDVRADQRIFIRGFPHIVMPGTCLSHELFGVDCPGCGLTRSIVYLAHGQWDASWRIHHVGWLMALAIVAQVPYRIACLRMGRPALGTAAPKVIGWGLIALLFGNWFVGLI